MKFILVMTLSGSTFFLIYVILRFCFGSRLSAGWYRGLLRMNLLYFLLPLPFLKEIYCNIWNRLCQVEVGFYDRVFWKEEMILFLDEGKFLLNETAKRQGLIWAGWISGTVIVGVWILVCYILKRRKMKVLTEHNINPEFRKMMQEIREDVGLRRQVETVFYEGNISPFTIGFWKPILFCANCQTKTEQKLILEHELTHIKYWDSLWRYIGLLAVIMHWFNPFAWLLKRELARISEYACDERVLQNKSMEQRRQYMALILAYAGAEKESLLSVGLSKDAKEIEGRMKNIMSKRRKLPAMVSAILMAAVVWLNSLTVFAYEDVRVARGEVFMDGSCVESDFLFIEDGKEAPDGFSFIDEYHFYYDAQFIDEEGIVYEVTEDNMSTYATCAHTYVSGQYQQHVTNSDGGCTVYVYSAKRCSKCGIIIDKVRISTTEFDVCIH